MPTIGQMRLEAAFQVYSEAAAALGFETSSWVLVPATGMGRSRIPHHITYEGTGPIYMPPGGYRKTTKHVVLGDETESAIRTMSRSFATMQHVLAMQEARAALIAR